MPTLQLQQQTLLGTVEKYQTLQVNSHNITLRQLLTEHIEACYLVLSPKLNAIQQKTAYEQQLNPNTPTPTNLLEIEQHIEKTLQLFQKNRFMVLVDDRQIQHLDEEFQLAPHSTLQFIKLIPLIGG